MTAWQHVNTSALFYRLLAALPGIDLFLDVGSLDGRESFAIEANLPHIKCIAFEPNPHNIAVIQKEITRRHSRLSLEKVAVGKENGTVSFYIRTPLVTANLGMSSMLSFTDSSRDQEFTTSTIEVPICRLDCLKALDAYHHLALWIDVEGVGYHVLEGFANIAHKVSLVHIEVETQAMFVGGKQASEVVQIMKGYGLELIGSNLGKDWRREQGDMVFLRKDTLPKNVLRRAQLNASLVKWLGVQRLAWRILPSRVYRAGRDWLVRYSLRS